MAFPRRACLIVLLFSLGLASPFALVPVGGSTFRPHIPIVINGDSAFTAENGVSIGSGTSADPFVIGGWDIMGTPNGISITGTSAHFVIRNVHIDTDLNSFSSCFNEETPIIIQGISLSYVSNGNVENSTILNPCMGIRVLFSEDISISTNAVSSGVQIGSSARIVVLANEIGGDGLVVGPWWSLFDPDLFTPEKVPITRPSDIRISENRVSSSYWAISVDQTSSVIVTGNTVTRSFGGIVVGYSNNTVISGNQITGIVTDPHNFGGGMVLQNAWNTTAYHNNLVDNFLQMHVLAGGDSQLDSGYPGGGNYWSDYVGADNCSGPSQDICPSPDGIGDTPYVVSLNVADRYPLMRPFALLAAGTADLNPSVVASRAIGRYLTAYIELPQGLELSTIVTSSIRLNRTIEPAGGTLATVGDHDHDGIPDFTVKFSMSDVKKLFSVAGKYSLQLSGNTLADTNFRPFVAYDTIRFR